MQGTDLEFVDETLCALVVRLLLQILQLRASGSGEQETKS